MKKYWRARRAAISIAALFFLAAAVSCAGPQRQVSLNGISKKHVLDIKASNFKFEPNNIKVFRGDKVTFRIENTSDTLHDFTLKDPGGKIIRDVDLPAGKTVVVPVAFEKTGIYTFYCDRPFHKQLGMKGQVEVVAK
ncbi:MAG: cupredoxin domain-containing protein [Actinomycetota bacterium]|nr:cupredoxin domain-containing protein [Actinomycetota bacterium]